MNLDDPTTVALLAADAFQRAGRPYALYGGLLLAAYGEPRETRDADVAVADLDVPTARAALESVGIETDIGFQDVRFGGLTVSRLTVLGKAADTGINNVDLVRPLSARYRSAALDRAVAIRMRGAEVRIVTPEDYIVFKALSTRDRDIEDAATVLLRMGKALDLDAIDREVALLAGELPDVDVRGRLAAIRARAAETP